MTLIKADIVEKIAKKVFTKRKSTQMVETILEIIKSSLENGEDVLISGFGKSCVKDKRKRRGRNPQTGHDLLLGERRVVRFTCSGVLRDKINAKEFSQAIQLKKTYKEKRLLGTWAERLRDATIATPTPSKDNNTPQRHDRAQ